MLKKFSCFLLCAAFMLGVCGCEGGKGSHKRSGVVIYEAYISGGYSSGENFAPYKYSYAVLHNPGETEVSLDGWALFYGEDGTGTVDEDRSAMLEGTIAPGGFFVIQGTHVSDAPKTPLGGALPFEVDLVSETFSPERKTGVLALCNTRNVKALSAFGKATEDYLEYGESDYLTSSTTVLNVTVKRVIRRNTDKNSGNNTDAFITKDIIDRPANIIYYTKGFTISKLNELSDQTKAAVTVSHESGYYNKEFSLKLETDLDANAKIYYTTDGSAPISADGVISKTAIEYKSGVRVYDRTSEKPRLMMIPGTCDPLWKTDTKDFIWPSSKKSGESESDYQKRLAKISSSYKVNVIKAAAVNDNKVVTPTQTKTYFVGSQALSTRYNMPVISIITESDYLYNEKTGIFMTKNRELRGTEAQRPMILQYFKKDGTLAFEESAKMQLNGGFTRMYPQKAMRINLSNDAFSYDLFNGKAVNSSGDKITYFDRFVLRAGGNQWPWGGLRDPFYQRYCAKLGTFGTQASTPATVFLNGEYWGTYFITERQDEYYIESHYGVARDDVIIVESFSSLNHGENGDEHELLDLRQFVVENDMSSEKNYKRFTDAVDVDSYIDYFICELYAGNTDWPHNNLKLWKSRNPDDTAHSKWKMLMNDMDWTLFLGIDSDHLHWILNQCDAANGKMFSSLMKNSGFKTKFITRFESLLNNFFKKNDMVSAYESLRKEMSAALGENQKRWALDPGGEIDAYTRLVNSIEQRNAIFRASLKKIK